MNVLSLFDGMSCGQIALNRVGIDYDNYFASELDKYAIKVTQHNYPKTIQLGDVQDVKASTLPIINLLIGGSPCQGFSFAGKQLNFEDSRSKLFFEYVRILKEIRQTNPDVLFLLENVKTKKEYQDIISRYMGCEPMKINSALVSAQNRERLYWTNIPISKMPDDKGIILKDIIIDGEVDRDKSYCIDASYHKGGNLNQYFNKSRRQIVFKIGNVNPSDKGEGVKITNCIQIGTASNINGHDILKRVYSIDGKSPTLNTMGGGNREPKIAIDSKNWRKLYPIECERLQTVPDNYTDVVSNSQRYKMLGNGWTVDVIAHIFKNLDLY